MNVRRSAGLVAVALAAGIAIGAAGSAAAANPTPAAPTADVWSRMDRMMQGAGMRGSTRMMGSPGSEDRAALVEQCDQLHDAMHAASSAPMHTNPRAN